MGLVLFGIYIGPLILLTALFLGAVSILRSRHSVAVFWLVYLTLVILSATFEILHDKGALNVGFAEWLINIGLGTMAFPMVFVYALQAILSVLYDQQTAQNIAATASGYIMFIGWVAFIYFLRKLYSKGGTMKP